MKELHLYRNYDLGSTSYVYGKFLESRRGFGNLYNGSSSTTVTATATGKGTFAGVIAGDHILIETARGTFTERVVASVTSPDVIVLTAAVDLSAAGTTGYGFVVLPFRSGTAATDGWVSVKDFTRMCLKIDIATLNATGGLDISLEAKFFDNATAMTILTKNFAAATPVDGSNVIELSDTVAAYRLGVKANAAYSGTDDISAAILGDMRR